MYDSYTLFCEEIPTQVFGDHLKQQVEDRLKYLDTGEAPQKNIDVMKEAVQEASIRQGWSKNSFKVFTILTTFGYELKCRQQTLMNIWFWCTVDFDEYHKFLCIARTHVWYAPPKLGVKCLKNHCSYV